MSSSEDAQAAGWYRFKEVTSHIPGSHKLFRSSSPNYMGFDSSLQLTDASVKFLKDMGIDGLISFNQCEYSEPEQKLLEEAGIAFLHLPVRDFTAASLEQLERAYNFVLKSNATLMHCGYGHGRTGTGVTAIQLYSTSGRQPPESDWRVVNRVEKEAQMEVLRELRSKLQS